MVLIFCANSFVPVVALPAENSSIAAEEQISDFEDARLASYKIESMPQSLRQAVLSDGASSKTLSSVNADDLYSVTIDNGDGTNTVNIFQKPVKYISDSGEIKFYTHTLERVTDSKAASRYAYKNEEGEVKTYYSDNIQNGVMLQYGDHTVSMAPLTDSSKFPVVNELMNTGSSSELGNAKSVSIATPPIGCGDTRVSFSYDTGKIMYHNVLANGITYEYMPIPNGIKENIILTSYNNINAFRFTVNIGELVPERMSVFGDGIRLVDPDDPEAEALFISPIYAYDTEGHISFEHAMYLTETNNEGEYILTVVVDREFLESSTTVYPVTIDPTIYPETTDYVADTFVSSYRNDRNYSAYGFFPVGNDSYYDQSEAFLQIKNLSQYSYISPYSITSATLMLDCYYTKGTADNPVEIYAYSNSANVNINTVNWDNRPQTSGSPYGTSTGGTMKVSNTTLCRLTITGLVQDWFKYEYNEGGQSYLRSLRLKMVNSTEDPHYATFRSTEYGTIYPYFSITYTPSIPFSSTRLFQVINLYSGMNLDAEQSNNFGVVQYTVDNRQNQWWMLRHLGNGVYKFENKWPYYQTQGRKFLSVSEVNSVVDLYYESDTLLTQRFYILPCYERDGKQNGYRIVPVYNADPSGGNKAIGNNGSRTRGASITYYTYNGNSDAQKWQFYEAYVNVNNYYDNGALTRWNLTSSQIQSNDQGIGYFSDIAKKLYLEQFDIYINHNTPQLLTSYADICAGSSTIEQLERPACAHGLGHKSENYALMNIGSDFYSNTSPRIVPVLWTGHRLSDIDYSIEHGVHGKAYSRERIILFNLNTENGFSSDPQKLCTYLHELAHCFGAHDTYCMNGSVEDCGNPYCVDCHAELEYGEDCLMSTYRVAAAQDAEDGDYDSVFCNKCWDDIYDYLTTLY